MFLSLGRKPEHREEEESAEYSQPPSEFDGSLVLLLTPPKKSRNNANTSPIEMRILPRNIWGESETVGANVHDIDRERNGKHHIAHAEGHETNVSRHGDSVVGGRHERSKLCPALVEGAQGKS